MFEQLFVPTFYICFILFIIGLILLSIGTIFFRLRKLEQSSLAWSKTTKALGWRYQRHGVGLPKGAMRLVPQLAQGSVLQTVEGVYEGVPFYLCELKPITFNRQVSPPTAVVAFDCAAVGMPLPIFSLRPKEFIDDLKVQMGYEFVPISAPYNQSVAFMLVGDNPAIEEAVGQFPKNFWKLFHELSIYCISDGEWFVYMRRDTTVVPTVEKMPDIVQRALHCYKRLNTHLQPFAPLGKEKPAYE